MHTVLRIPELVLEIVSRIGKESDLFHFGVTCKDLWGLVEDDLWGDVVDVDKLYCLIPGPIDFTPRGMQELTQTMARRCSSIRRMTLVDTCVVDHRGNWTTLPDGVCDRLVYIYDSFSNPGVLKSFVNSVHQLELALCPKSISSCQTMFNDLLPPLSVLDIRLIGAHAWPSDSVTLLLLLIQGLARPGSLQRLRISNDRGESEPGQRMPAAIDVDFSPIFAHDVFDQLTHLDLIDLRFRNAGILLKLSNLPCLKHLALGVIRDHRLPTLPDTAFPQLRSIELSASPYVLHRDHLHILSSITSQYLSHVGFCCENGPSCQSSLALMAVKWPSSLRRVSIFMRANDELMEVLSPLFRVEHLQHLEVTTRSCILLSDSDMQRIVQTWPHLIILELHPIYVPASLPKPLTTPRALLYIAKGLRRLKRLAISVDLDVIVDIPEFESSSAVTVLNLGLSRCVDPTDAAWFISSVFPSLSHCDPTVGQNMVQVAGILNGWLTKLQ